MDHARKLHFKAIISATYKQNISIFHAWVILCNAGEVNNFEQWGYISPLKHVKV